MYASTSSQQTPTLTVFISYSHQDSVRKKELENYLSTVVPTIRFISDENLSPGDVWVSKLQEMRQEADVYLLLVTNNYLHSTGVGPELNEIITQGKSNPALKVIPIILEPSVWVQSPIAAFQALPRFGKSVSEYSDPYEAYQEIADALVSIAQLKQNNKAIDIINQEKELQSGLLKITDCNLSTIPRDLLDMPWLKELFLDGNQIKKLENLDNLTALKELSITHNEVERIENLDNLTNLEVLDLADNNIRQLENLTTNTALKKLGLSSNEISSLAGIVHLQNLEILYSSHNHLTQIDELKQLPNLKRIVLTNNQIQSIKPLLGHIEKGLKVALLYSFKEEENGVFLKDNPTLSEPSIEVIEKGRNAVLKYFDDAETYGTRKLEIVKLILVGNSKVGKTNFSEFLRGVAMANDHISTHLLDIQRWDASFLTSKSGIPMRVNIFDFGGQDYYHDSHRMYYSHDTAYILLWDTDTNNYLELTESIPGEPDVLTYENFPLEYWLESINYNLADKFKPTFKASTEGITKPGNTAPVLVLQNKIDIREGYLDQRTLSTKYTNIAGFFNMSLKAQKRTSILSEVLNDYMSALNLSGRQLIEFEHKIIEDYLTNERPFNVISLNDFWAECVQIIDDATVPFTKENAQIIAQILNAIGIVFYDKRSDSDGFVFTRINRLNELVKEIMDVAKAGNDKGFFTINQISHISNHIEVVDLLLRNNSFIKINDTEFLAPQFLPVKPDQSITFFLSAFTHNHMRFVYKAYFHKTLLLNLFSTYLKGVTIDTSSGVKSFPFWRNGIIVSKGEGAGKQMVYVEFVKDTNQGIVNIRTMSPFNKYGLEREIEITLDKLNAGWTVCKEISVNSIDFFDVQTLKSEVKENRFEFSVTKLVADKPYINTFSVNDFKNIIDFEKLPKKLFISYSSKNSDFIRRFVTHLEILKSNGIIDPWYDRMIESGSKWDDTIRNEMRNSDVIIFLLSPDFLATEYIMKTEIPLAIEQLKNEKSVFFFVELQPCGWKRTEIFNYQQTGDPTKIEKNVISIGSPNNDDMWNRVMDALEKKMNA